LYIKFLLFIRIKMFNKYYQIKSCYERENKETKRKEVVLVWNEIKGKWLLSSFSNYFILTPDDFMKKFWSKVKNDEYNKGLERVNFEVWVEYAFEVHGVVDKLPDNLK